MRLDSKHFSLSHYYYNSCQFFLRQALADLPSLRELDLSDNRLIADALEGPIFDLPNLLSLNLSSNKLSRLGHQVRDL